MGGGDIYVGGNMTWTNPSLPHNAYVAGNVTNSSGGGSVCGTVYYAGKYTSSAGNFSHQAVSAASIATPIDFLSAKTSLDSLSATLAADSVNGTVTSAYGTYTLTGTDASLNAFSLTGGGYSGATVNITAPAGSTVIVNVPGSSDSFKGGSINLSGVTSANVIFNFNSASTLALASIAFNGSILAPYADFTGTYGQINGQLIATSAAGTTQFNNSLFSGSLGVTSGSSSETPSAPKPSTCLLFMTGAGAVAKRCRR